MNSSTVNVMTYDILTYIDKDRPPTQETRDIVKKLKRNALDGPISNQAFKDTLKQIEAEITKRHLIELLKKEGSDLLSAELGLRQHVYEEFISAFKEIRRNGDFEINLLSHIALERDDCRYTEKRHRRCFREALRRMKNR